MCRLVLLERIISLALSLFSIWCKKTWRTMDSAYKQLAYDSQILLPNPNTVIYSLITLRETLSQYLNTRYGWWLVQCEFYATGLTFTLPESADTKKAVNDFQTAKFLRKCIDFCWYDDVENDFSNCYGHKTKHSCVVPAAAEFMSNLKVSWVLNQQQIVIAWALML